MKTEPNWQTEDLANCEVVEADESFNGLDSVDCSKVIEDFLATFNSHDTPVQQWTEQDNDGSSAAQQPADLAHQLQVVQMQSVASDAPSLRQEITLFPNPDNAVIIKQHQSQQQQQQQEHEEQQQQEQQQQQQQEHEEQQRQEQQQGHKREQADQPSTSRSAQLQPQPPPYKKRRKGKMLLWQFLLHDLVHGNSNLMWLEDQVANPGVFVFRDPNQAARRWGQYKENDNMSYEKMSRCIRDYWIRDDNKYFRVMVQDPTRGRRLHFAFNLENKKVQQFIQNYSVEYYQKLVDQRLI